MVNIPDPNNFDDPDKIRNLMVNARRLGYDDLVVQCQIRIAELGSQQFDDALEKEFWTAVYLAEEFKSFENGKATRLTRTRQKYNRDGAKKSVEDLAGRPAVTESSQMLADNGRVDLTIEAVLLRHANQFDESAVTTAKAKLLDNGVDEMTIEGWLNG
ncbi:hypothetical protein PZ897_19780 [Hoeflea sp. YIM 152468]|uniref:hypothetical protein n=1 Tax=Hoeflea sp. YIM 152468 TaxID=3031759 RepID=UPI0023DCCDDC|nr:hypothetical protein [Hoeflea sp. YIM 152468]MDF1610427.1 hypothetical protein [Hoeflea sp. YIM 152468]